MVEPAVEFKGVSHCFRVSSDGNIKSLKAWLIERSSGKAGRLEDHVVLEDVSFAVEQGCTLGVIGRNGVGKSTLLRIAAGILQPAAGEAVVRGRIAPIIELGVGFEQELTGRENIVFNGALLGRSREEMTRRMDDIVDFAELGEFIDQPIRKYSTGMVARLAFAVATTVDAHVLLLDEVLSVGDERFNRKCQERMNSFREKGVSILFVSHDLNAVETLCDEAIWLKCGRIKAKGKSADVIAAYRAWGSRDDCTQL